MLDEIHRGSRRVAACSAEAKALGVTVGMPSAEAAALAGAATLAVEAYDPSADREALEALAEWCGRFSPLVGLDDCDPPDSLLLDVTGLAHLFGSEGSLAETVVHAFAERRLAVYVAVADTIGAAWAVSHFGQSSICNLQSAICNPQSSILPGVLVPSGESAAALRPLPVDALRLPDGVVELLHQLGIYRIGQLELLPREDLTSRFGRRLLERWDQAVGRLAEPTVAHPLPPELCARHSLEPPTTRRATIEHVLEQLIADVSRRLVRCGRGAVRLECRFDCRPARDVNLSIGLFQPTALPRHLFELVRMQLERVSLPAPVSSVEVEAAATAPFEPRQEELFADSGCPKRLRQLAGLVDRLSSRLGRRLVLRARLVRDAQPEWAYRYDSLVSVSPSGRSRRDLGGTGVSPVRVRSRGREGQAVRYSTGQMPVAPWRGTPATLPRRRSKAELPPRPLRLLARPVPLAAVSIVPDGPPLRFHFQGHEHRIAHTWGPERIETGWWRGRPVRRDYYRVETTTGRRYWLFRDLGDGGWFLHGAFE